MVTTTEIITFLNHVDKDQLWNILSSIKQDAIDRLINIALFEQQERDLRLTNSLTHLNEGDKL